MNELKKWCTLNVKKSLDSFFEQIEMNPTFIAFWGSGYKWNKNVKPIIFDMDDKNVYYLQSTYFEKENKTKVFDDDIFVMDKKEFESFIDFDNNVDKIKLLNNKTKNQILEKIKKNTFEIDPYLTLTKIFISKNNKNITKHKPIYVCEKKVKWLYDMLSDKNMYFPLNDEQWEKLPKIESNRNSKNSYNRNNYINGINFCIKFLEKHFPNDVQKFMEKQNVTKEWLKNNYIKYNVDIENNIKKSKNIERER